MFKWFAPLLLFAGKPDVVIRLVTIAIAAAVLAYGVWLISNVALTVDTLKNPTIAAIYGIVLFCFFAGVGTIAWLRLRRTASPPQLDPPGRQVELPPLPTDIVTQRAQEISKKWQPETLRPAVQNKNAAHLVPAAAPPVALKPAKPASATLTVTGPAYTGKTALIATLAQTGSARPVETSEVVKLVDAGPIDGKERHFEALLARAAASDGVLFVVDQDLRAPEVAAITRFIATGKPLYVVLNKADNFNAVDRDTILISIRAKMPQKFAPGFVVSVAGAPSPVEREIEDARGAVRVELRRPSSDIRALTNLLARFFPPAPGQMLRFEAE